MGFDRVRYFRELFNSYKILPERGYVLEVGAGISGPVYYVEDAKVIGIALDPYLVALKPSNTRGVERICAVGEYLPFKERSIESVMLHNSLDHSSNPRMMLDEVERVSRERVFVLARIFDQVILSLLGKAIKLLDRGHPYHFTKKAVLDLINDRWNVVCVKAFRGDHLRVPYRRLVKLRRFKRLVALLLQERVVVLAETRSIQTSMESNCREPDSNLPTTWTVLLCKQCKR